MSAEPVIRPAGPEDAERCAEIAVEAWRPVFASWRELLGEKLFQIVYSDWEAVKRGQVVEFLTKWPQMAIVTELEGRVVGFLTYHFWPDKPVAEIGNNAVAPGHQGLGIGTRQVRHAMGLFRERGVTVATVMTGLDEGHTPARCMYVNSGFGPSLPMIRYFSEIQGP